MWLGVIRGGGTGYITAHIAIKAYTCPNNPYDEIDENEDIKDFWG
jgi:hypothetical protein